MDSDNVACPSCGTRYRFTPELSGRAVQCSRCGDVFLMPATGRRKRRRTRPTEATEDRPRVSITDDLAGGTPAGRPRGGPADPPDAGARRDDAGGAPRRPADAGGRRRDASGAPGSGPVVGETHVGTPDGIEVHGGALDKVGAIPLPGDAPAVGELGLTAGGGPTIHEPAGRQSAGGTAGDTTCAACGRALSPSAVICVACGWDRRTGQKVDTELR